jgi:hypothetical protein
MGYIQDFITVIQRIENDTTYKLAWARALLECIENEEYEIQGEQYVVFHYESVQKVLKYYWNQIAFFKLSQGPSSILDTRIEEIEQDFIDNTNIKYPVWYDKIESFLKRNPIRFERQVKKFITFVNKGVAAKFEKISRSEKVELYELDTKFKCVRFTKNQITLLKENSYMLHDIIDFKWAMLLDDYNKAPNIIRKVIGSKVYRFKRENVIKFRNVLLEYLHLDGIKDFYTEEPLHVDDISLEHVIPYDFIYSCDIWNLIVVSKETAKKRRGKIPTDADIQKLNKRNHALYDAIKDTHLQVRFDLEDALDNHLLTRYYIDLKG